jgi:choline dehydrogenase-like flavoprotein
VLDRWHQQFGLADGLPEAALDAAFTTLEEEMSVRPVVEGVTAGRQDLLLRDGAARAGVEARFIHRNERGCRGSGRCLHGCPHQAKQSTAVNYLRRAVEDGAVVVAHARTRRVILRGRRAVAVSGTVGGRGREAGQRFRLRARRAVVVAGGAIQSSNLLWRSGLHVRHLGEHFMAHPGTAVMALYPDPVGAWSGASQGTEAIGLRDTLGVKLESINVPPEVTAARLPGPGRRLAGWWERLGHVANWAVAVRADGEGRVRPSWLFGDRVSYDVTPSDLERLRQGMKRLAEMHFLAGATEVLPNVAGLPEVLRSADELHGFDEAPLDARAYSLVATHLFGGCRAGRDAASSVVDPQLKVHGADGLYVMDASVFPSNTGVNPQHSIMAVAMVAAARLA